MKTLATILMAVVILAGLILAITPFVADRFFPVPENTIRTAKPQAAAMALKRIFDSPDAQFVDVQAINKSSAGTQTSWFAFSVDRKPVEKYIIGNQLQQLELNDDVLVSTFSIDKPPATWWEPGAIKQQTYFNGTDQGRQISLLYNPDTKRGLLVSTNKKQSSRH